jgi:PGF-CTERM protein
MMKNAFVVALIALFILLTASITVSAQGNTTTNESLTVSQPYANETLNVTNTTQSSTYTTPGFEALFALIGLVASAYLVLGRK